jgi:predicted amidohydrolase
MDFRIAVVQPRIRPEEGEGNVKYACEYIAEAAGLGARIVCFPELYPGPWAASLDYDPLPTLGEAARDHGVHVLAGMVEEVPGEPERHHVALVLIGSDGEEVGRYRRMIPEGPWIYKGAPFHGLDYKSGAELPVFDLGDTTIGLLMCSELYVPELARMLAVAGAEIIFMPAGNWKKGQWETWRILMRARSIENLAYTATCQNIVGTEGRHPGLAMICSPEEILAESSGVGVLVADCDLDRLRMLRREEDRRDFPDQKACKTGVLWQWYRPDLFRKLKGEG